MTGALPDDEQAVRASAEAVRSDDAEVQRARFGVLADSAGSEMRAPDSDAPFQAVSYRWVVPGAILDEIQQWGDQTRHLRYRFDPESGSIEQYQVLRRAGSSAPFLTRLNRGKVLPGGTVLFPATHLGMVSELRITRGPDGALVHDYRGANAGENGVARIVMRAAASPEPQSKQQAARAPEKPEVARPTGPPGEARAATPQQEARPPKKVAEPASRPALQPAQAVASVRASAGDPARRASSSTTPSTTASTATTSAIAEGPEKWGFCRVSTLDDGMSYRDVDGKTRPVRRFYYTPVFDARPYGKSPPGTHPIIGEWTFDPRLQAFAARIQRLAPPRERIFTDHTKHAVVGCVFVDSRAIAERAIQDNFAYGGSVPGATIHVRTTQLVPVTASGERPTADMRGQGKGKPGEAVPVAQSGRPPQREQAESGRNASQPTRSVGSITLDDNIERQERFEAEQKRLRERQAAEDAAREARSKKRQAEADAAAATRAAEAAKRRAAAEAASRARLAACAAEGIPAERCPRAVSQQ